MHNFYIFQILGIIRRRSRNVKLTFFRIVVLSIVLALFLVKINFHIFFKKTTRYNAENDVIENMKLNLPSNFKYEGPFYKIAIVLALSTKTIEKLKYLEMPLFKNLLKSFCKTQTNGFNYTFYIGFDYNDRILKQRNNRRNFKESIKKYLKTNCGLLKPIEFHLIQVNYSGKPTWVQNDLMKLAYLKGNDYFYRVNDDIVFHTKKWTEYYIRILELYNPKNVGVVGPSLVNTNVNSKILTFDFVHKTHLNIFGYYYPRQFPGWFGDDWISHVYQPFRSTRSLDVLVIHDRTTVRYDVKMKHVENMNDILLRDKNKVDDYIKSISSLPLSGVRKARHLIFVMNFDEFYDDYLYGLLRNTHLINRYFPEYGLQVFINNQTNLPAVYKPFFEQFQFVKFNFNVSKLNSFFQPNVDMLLFRNVRGRISHLERKLHDEFVDSNKSCHIIINNENSQNHFVSFKLSDDRIRKVLRKSIINMPDNNALNKILKIFNHQCLIHDKINCSITYNENHPQISSPIEDYIGKIYDSNDMPIFTPTFTSVNKRKTYCVTN